MIKTALRYLGYVALVIGAIIAFFVGPQLYDGFHSALKKQSLQSRADYPQIASACISLARSITNEPTNFKPSDPPVPAKLRSLAPHYISVYSNHVTLEFHGGFDHYGYRVEQSDDDSRLWTISFYTEQGHKLLTTITNK